VTPCLPGFSCGSVGTHAPLVVGARGGDASPLFMQLQKAFLVIPDCFEAIFVIFDLFNVLFILF